MFGGNAATFSMSMLGGVSPAEPLVAPPGSSQSPFAAGGLFPSQDTPRSGNGPAKQRTKNNIFPVTIQAARLANTDGTDSSEIFGTRVTQMLLVAQVMQVEHKQTSYDFVLDDSTGTIPCVWFSPGDAAATVMQKIKRLSYVQVIGRIKEKNNGTVKYISAVQVSLVLDPNQIAFHLIECLWAAVKQTKGDVNTSRKLQMGAGTPMGSPVVSSFGSPADATGDVVMGQPPVITQAPISHPAAAPAAAASAAAAPAMNVSIERVKELINECNTTKGDLGSTWEEIREHAATKGVSDAVLKPFFLKLQDDCEIFTTIDDFHWTLC